MLFRSFFVGSYIEYKQPDWATKMKNPLLIIPIAVFFGVFITRLIFAPYEKHKQQRREISDFKRALKSKNTQTIKANTDEEYNAELFNIREDVKNIIENFAIDKGTLLIDRAARYLINQAARKYKIENWNRAYFSHPLKAFAFYNWLIGTPRKYSHELGDLDIGKHCTALFLIYDRWPSDRPFSPLIIARAQVIIREHLTNSQLSSLVEIVKLQLEDVFNDCKNPPQSKADKIGFFRSSLNIINAYLKDKGLLKEEDI